MIYFNYSIFITIFIFAFSSICLSENSGEPYIETFKKEIFFHENKPSVSIYTSQSILFPHSSSSISELQIPVDLSVCFTDSSGSKKTFHKSDFPFKEYKETWQFFSERKIIRIPLPKTNSLLKIDLSYEILYPDAHFLSPIPLSAPFNLKNAYFKIVIPALFQVNWHIEGDIVCSVNSINKKNTIH